MHNFVVWNALVVFSHLTFESFGSQLAFARNATQGNTHCMLSSPLYSTDLGLRMVFWLSGDKSASKLLTTAAVSLSWAGALTEQFNEANSRPRPISFQIFVDYMNLIESTVHFSRSTSEGIT